MRPNLSRQAYLFAGLVGLLVLVTAAGLWWVTSLNARARDAQQHLVAARDALGAGAGAGVLNEAATSATPGQTAGAAAQLNTACSETQQADALLRDVGGQLQPVMPLVEALASVPVVGDRTYAQTVTLDTGAQLASAGTALCEGVRPLADLLVAGQGTSGSADTTTATLQALLLARPKLVEAADRLDGTLASINKISDADLDVAARNGLEGLHARLPAMIQGLRDAAALVELLGDNTERRFLLISQNPDELRATGGYIGSAGVLSVQNGKVRLVEYGSSRAYDTPADRRAITPSPFNAYLGDYWQLAGANWWVSFPDVARQLAYFYSVARPDQPPVDGVVAVDQFALRGLLQVLGPVDVPEYAERVGASDVQAALDRYVHAGDGADEAGRKQFTAALSAAVLQQILDAPKSQLPSLVRAARGALEEQHFLISVWDPAAAAVLARHRWDGSLLPSAGDALLVADTELSAGKQSQSVKRDVSYSVDLSTPDRAKARVAITYTNVSQPEPNVFYIADYRTFVRAYAPSGAKLSGSAGFAKDVVSGQECGRTAFGGEVLIPRGRSVTVELAYELPADGTTQGAYDLVLQQQPGTPPGQLAVEVRGPNGAVVRAAENNQARRGYHWHVSDTSSPKLDELPLAAPAPGGCSTPLVAAAPIAAPDWLEIPTAHISAPLVELGVDAQGAMEAPPTPDVVGWYRMSARAGQPGNAVLSGHVDWGQNTAVFWGLRDLQPADVILLRGADGVEHTYKVAWNRVVSRTDASATELVHGSNGAVLTLITCDGVYDRSIREYSDRRIVRAVLSN